MAACAPLICFVPWTSSSPCSWTPKSVRGSEVDGAAGPRRGQSRGRSKEKKASAGHGHPGKKRSLRSFSAARQDDLPELEAPIHPSAGLLFEEVERLVAKHHCELNTCCETWLRRYGNVSGQLQRTKAEAKQVQEGLKCEMPEGLKHADVHLETSLGQDPQCWPHDPPALVSCLPPATRQTSCPSAATCGPAFAARRAATAPALEVSRQDSPECPPQDTGGGHMPSNRSSNNSDTRTASSRIVTPANAPVEVLPSGNAMNCSQLPSTHAGRRISGVHGVIQEVKRARSRRKRALKPFQELLASRIEDAQKAQTLLQRFFASRAYDIISGVLIVLNSILIGVQTQLNAEATLDRVDRVDRGQGSQNGDTGVPETLMLAQACFTLVFTLELGLRWMSEGLLHFFLDVDKWWNVFDIWVVGLSVLDVVMEYSINQQAVLENISVLRVTRVVRVVRVARIIRIMKFFRELRMMIYSILGSMKSLLWVVVVLCMTFYIFGITFTAATAFELRTLDGARIAETEALRQSFGTVDKSLLSLFQAMSGGQDWGVFYEALGVLAAPYRYFFLLFILFAVFAVINIVTGVFVDSALASNTQDRDIIIHEELESKKAYLKSLRELFEEMDEDDSGSISLAEFEAKLDDERVIAYFHALKLDVGDARTLFWLLDYDHSNAVNIDEFMEGCYSLQGEARSLDTKLMQQEVRCLREKFDVFHHMVIELQDSMDVIVPEANKPKLRRVKTTPAQLRGNTLLSLDSQLSEVPACSGGGNPE